MLRSHAAGLPRSCKHLPRATGGTLETCSQLSYACRSPHEGIGYLSWVFSWLLMRILGEGGLLCMCFAKAQSNGRNSLVNPSKMCQSCSKLNPQIFAPLNLFNAATHTFLKVVNKNQVNKYLLNILSRQIQLHSEILAWHWRYRGTLKVKYNLCATSITHQNSKKIMQFSNRNK